MKGFFRTKLERDQINIVEISGGFLISMKLMKILAANVSMRVIIIFREVGGAECPS